MSDLFLNGLVPRVKVQPLVYFAILDHYLRRNENQTRVIGTLLGTVTGLQIEVTSSFPVPHEETDDSVAVDTDYHTNMLALHQQVNPKEVVVGWYATGDEITEHSLLIHNHYMDHADQPIHITVDTDLKDGKFKSSAFFSADMGAVTKGKLFTPIECTTHMHESEKIALKTLDKTLAQPDGTVSLASGLDQVTEATDKLQSMIDEAIAYVKKVVSGEIEGDASVGRYLRDTVSAVPKVDAETFNQMFNDIVQDHLMVAYLANLVQTQVSLQEKLNGIL